MTVVNFCVATTLSDYSRKLASTFMTLVQLSLVQKGIERYRKATACLTGRFTDIKQIKFKSDFITFSGISIGGSF
jgi:hypothetical protein